MNFTWLVSGLRPGSTCETYEQDFTNWKYFRDVRVYSKLCEDYKMDTIFLLKEINWNHVPYLADHGFPWWCSHLGCDLSLTASTLWFHSHFLVFAYSHLYNDTQSKESTVELKTDWSSWKKQTENSDIQDILQLWVLQRNSSKSGWY